MSHRLHETNADKQRAYRARKRAAGDAGKREPSPPPGKARQPSRAARIQQHVLGLQALAAEYQHWRDRLPPNMASGATAERLDEAAALFEELAAMLDAFDPPAVGR